MHAVREHTHALLGRTITYSAEDWAAPTRLLGWTRSHVAAHFIKGGRAIARLCRSVLAGFLPGPYDTSLGKQCELLSLADGLRLQIELDTTAGELDALLAQLAGASGTAQLHPELSVPVAALPLVRLRELVLHTFDLEPDEPRLEVDPGAAVPLLVFEAEVSPPPQPTRLITPEGPIPGLDPADAQCTAEGPAADLLAWLARDVISERLMLTRDQE